MQNIIADAAESKHSGDRVVDLSKWPPVIDDLIAKGGVSPRQALSYIWWHDAAVMPYVDALPKELHKTAMKLRDDDLSPEWAVIAGMACLKHWQSDEDLQPSFQYLAGEFFRRAQAKKPEWDLPYYCLLATYERFVMDQVPRDFHYNHPYAKTRPYLKPSPGEINATAPELMREYINATSFDRVQTPPWAGKVAQDGESEREAEAHGPPFIIGADSISGVDWLTELLLEISVEDKNAEDSALVVDFCAAEFEHSSGGFSTRLSNSLSSLMRVLPNRIADADIVADLRSASWNARKSYSDVLTESDYYRMYPNGEVTFEQACRLERKKIVERDVIAPMRRASARLRELGTNAFAPKGLREGIQEFHSEIAAINSLTWPLSDDASEYWSRLPIQGEFTYSGKYAMSYIVAKLKPLADDSNTYNVDYKYLEAAYNDPDASFVQRASVVYWWHQSPYRDVENLHKKFLQDIEQDPQLVDTLSPEWVYALARIAREAQNESAGNSKEAAAERQHYSELEMKYLSRASKIAPDWALVQKERLDSVLDGIMHNPKMNEIDIGIAMPIRLTSSNGAYVSEQELSDSFKAITEFINAKDDSVWLPPPWTCRIGRDELMKTAPDAQLLGWIEELNHHGSYFVGDDVDLYPVGFLAEIAYRQKDGRTIALSIDYLDRLFELYPHYGDSADAIALSLFFFYQTIEWYLADTPAKTELKELTDTSIQRSYKSRQRYDEKLQRLKLTGEDLDAVKAARAREQEKLKVEVVAATARAREILSGLKESDFADLDKYRKH